MAGAAGSAVLHVLHGRWVRSLSGCKDGRMTFGAGELCQVDGVRKEYFTDILIGKGDINGLGMAGDAIALDAESTGTVVTGAAGFAVLHVLHG